MATDTLTKQQKADLTARAWAEYRAEAAKLRDLGWTDYLDADDRIWRRYLTTERLIASAPEPKAA